ncbi:phage tail protein [Burkholderia multivorans]|uniref:gp53-like domain-containing protein n=1 Tax=Burkholderia multivorans TaxID=87883 RepID=UPI000D004DAC|nr:phage tail protein [Burkholderia multivorans]PRF69321.1 phage tail protein [Burkholderia multivorans]
MDYTTSLDNVVHGATGRRMHSDSIAVPTVWSGNDANMVIWSMMEVLAKAGIAGQVFNPDDPASYTRFRDALTALFAQFQFKSKVYDVNATKVLPVSALGGVVNIYGSGPFTVTLPAVSDCPVGSTYTFISSAAGTVTLVAQGADKFSGNVGSSVPLQAGSTLTIMAAGGGYWWFIWGSATLRIAPEFATLQGINGFAKLPGGNILQWGRYNTGTSPVTVTFPIAFPTEVCAITCTPLSTLAYGTADAVYGTAGLASFQVVGVQMTSNNVQSSHYGNYIAIGR